MLTGQKKKQKKNTEAGSERDSEAETSHEKLGLNEGWVGSKKRKGREVKKSGRGVYVSLKNLCENHPLVGRGSQNSSRGGH